MHLKRAQGDVAGLATPLRQQRPPNRRRHRQLTNASAASRTASAADALAPGNSTAVLPSKARRDGQGEQAMVDMTAMSAFCQPPADAIGSDKDSKLPNPLVVAEGNADISSLGESGKGAISQLQEFVQGAKYFPMPPNCPVLQWAYSTRMVDTSLKFRATVAFMLDGVPHHSVGSWKPSKKLAQRDTAERALGLFVSRWGALAALDPRHEPSRSFSLALGQDRDSQRSGDGEPNSGASSLIDALEDLCARLAVPGLAPTISVDSPAADGADDAPAVLHDAAAGQVLRWSHRWDTDEAEANLCGASDGSVPSDESPLCQAFVEVQLLGVPHTFPGRPCGTQREAYEDVARRVLWYLQCPGHEDTFEPDLDYVKVATQEIPQPVVSEWVKDDDGKPHQDPHQHVQLQFAAAERKTVLMRVQNRLQQAFARQLETGTSVWHWSYDRETRDHGWPPLYRASAHVPLAGRWFSGRWTRGQREAQIDTCGQIAEFLDAEFPRSRHGRNSD